MKKYRIREGSPMAWARDIGVGTLLAVGVFGFPFLHILGLW